MRIHANPDTVEGGREHFIVLNREPCLYPGFFPVRDACLKHGTAALEHFSRLGLYQLVVLIV